MTDPTPEELVLQLRHEIATALRKQHNIVDQLTDEEVITQYKFELLNVDFGTPSNDDIMVEECTLEVVIPPKKKES